MSIQFPMEHLFAQLPGVIFWQGVDSIFSGCNDIAFKLFGFKNAEQMIGKTYSDFRCKAQESSNIFVKQDKQVISAKSTLKFIITDIYSHGKIEAHLVTKKPIFFQDSLAGVIVHGMLISAKTLMKMVTGLSNVDVQYKQNNISRRSYTLTTQYGDINISKRESECLFYLLRRRSVPEIANILQLSKRTIESYIDNIKFKMNCYSQDELREKSISLGFLNIIPFSLASEKLILDFSD